MVIFKTRYRANKISIHAPAKGATVPHLSEHYRIAISIHAPAKGATPCRYRRSAVHAGFQSTLPRRERRRSGAGNCQRWDFNPRSREGSDDIPNYKDLILWISIHAPAKGATEAIEDIGAENLISIHAPAKGATDWIGSF